MFWGRSRNRASTWRPFSPHCSPQSLLVISSIIGLCTGKPVKGYPCARTLAFLTQNNLTHTNFATAWSRGVNLTWHGFGLRCVQPVSIVRWRRGTGVPTDRNCQGYGMKVPLVLSRATIDTPLHKLGGKSGDLVFQISYAAAVG